MTDIKQFSVIIDGTRYVAGFNCQPGTSDRFSDENLSNIFETIAKPVRILLDDENVYKK